MVKRKGRVARTRRTSPAPVTGAGHPQLPPLACFLELWDNQGHQLRKVRVTLNVHPDALNLLDIPATDSWIESTVAYLRTILPKDQQ